MVDNLETGTLALQSSDGIVRSTDPVSTLWNCTCAGVVFSGSRYHGHFVPYYFCPGVVNACTGFGSIPEQHLTYYPPRLTR